MQIDVTGANQMTSLGSLGPGHKVEFQIGVFGSGDGVIELQITRPGLSARTVGTYSGNTDPDDLATLLGPCDDVSIGIPSGGTYNSGTINIEVTKRFV